MQCQRAGEPHEGSGWRIAVVHQPEAELRHAQTVALGLMSLGYDVRSCNHTESQRSLPASGAALEDADAVVMVVSRDPEPWVVWLDQAARLAKPVVVLSATPSVEQEISALSRGAADYLAIPHDLFVLSARVRRSIARSLTATSGLRAAAGASPSAAPADVLDRTGRDVPLIVGPLVIDVVRRRVTCCGKVRDLTPTELSLVATLARAEGAPLSVGALTECIATPHRKGAVGDVRTFIRRVRVKLGSEAWLIETTDGGYRLRSSPRTAVE